MRISDWSSDVCSSDLDGAPHLIRRISGARWIARCRPSFPASSPFRRPTRFHHKPAPDFPHASQRPEEEDSRRTGRNGRRTGGRGRLDAAKAGFVEIGRASCRERVGQYVYISVVAVSLKKKTTNTRVGTEYVSQHR